ncbi:MAG: PEGA domain-containing protein, partial [Methanofollis sp.]|uniref:PEGA domain-containing protein n=1 Tax=Methanofollis sp. TaxID=2052835 RepID=UPI002607D2A1
VTEGKTAVIHLDLTTLTGSLAVTSAPTGALILIDGADTGKITDATVDGIAVGEHTVTLTKDGYRTAEANVTIRYNETTTLTLDLVAATGNIAVASTPDGAKVFLDGTDTGTTTNATLENVPAGEHTITVKKSGYMDASTTVTVADTETATVSLTLLEPSGSIRVTSSPDGARIILDGTDTGEMTNATLTRISPGEHTIALSLEGYLDAEETVTVAVGETAEVHVALSRAAITLRPGWNFVSTPKTLAAGQDTIAIFDEVDTGGHSVLLYNGTNRWEAMSSAERFQPLDGVWIFANGTYTIPLTFAGGSVSTPPTKDLDEGWNAIGFSDTVPEAAATTLRAVEKNWMTLFAFDAANQAYDVSIIRGATGRHGDDRPMNPMQGYWLYMNSPDTLCAIGA